MCCWFVKHLSFECLRYHSGSKVIFLYYVADAIFCTCMDCTAVLPFVFLEALSTLQKIVLSQTTVLEGLVVSSGPRSIISGDNAQPCILQQYVLYLIYYTSISCAATI